jgi:hypothetical protein
MLHNTKMQKCSDWIERMFMLSRLLKSVVVGAFVVGSSLALSLPTPKDIEAAVAAGRYTQAESMLREVLQDKPQSAKAHYELGQVLAQAQRYKEAQTELQKAKDIDPSLKFAASPEKFNSVWAKVNDLAATPTTSVVVSPSVAPSPQAANKATSEAPSNGGGSSMQYVWLAIAGLVVFGLWLRRSTVNAVKNAQATGYVPAATPMGTTMGAPMGSTMATPMGSPAATRGFGAQFTPNATQTAYGAQGAYGPQGGYAQPNTRGSGMAGAVVGGLAGVAAGYALSKAFEGDHSAAPSAAADASPGAGNSGYVPFDAPAPTEFGAFDAGSGSDWDSGDSGGGDDSW